MAREYRNIQTDKVVTLANRPRCAAAVIAENRAKKARAMARALIDMGLDATATLELARHLDDAEWRAVVRAAGRDGDASEFTRALVLDVLEHRVCMGVGR